MQEGGEMDQAAARQMMDATLPRDFARAGDVEVCQVLGCPVGAQMATELARLQAALAYAEAQHAHKHQQVESLRAELAAMTAERDKLLYSERLSHEAIGAATQAAEEAQAEINAISGAIPTRYLDPPDGGTVPVVEQVRRVVAEVEALRATLTESRGYVVAELERVKSQYEGYPKLIERKSCADQELLATINALLAASSGGGE